MQKIISYIITLIAITSCNNETPKDKTASSNDTGGTQQEVPSLNGYWAASCQSDPDDEEGIAHSKESYKFGVDGTGYKKIDNFLDSQCSEASTSHKFNFTYKLDNPNLVDITFSGYFLTIKDSNVYDAMISSQNCPQTVPFQEEFDTEICAGLSQGLDILKPHYAIFKVSNDSLYLSEWSSDGSQRPSSLLNKVFASSFEVKSP